MKHFLFIIFMIIFAAGSVNAADVGVSVSVSQPGFYGRLDIGDAPRPQVIYAQPVVIRPAPVHVVQEPIYLHVPPGHAKNWKKHCRKYNACGQPVYFVREKWYKNVYVPHQQARVERHGKDQGYKHREGERGDHGHGRGHDRD